MDRRDFLFAAAGTFAGVATQSGLFPSEAFAAGAAPSELVHTDGKILKQLEVVAKAANDCVAAGLACDQHCHEQLLQGNHKEFAECATSVQQMLPVCRSIAELATYRAKVIADFLSGCIKACETCEKACKKHEPHFAHGMHAQCKRCMEACAACRDACRQLKKLV